MACKDDIHNINTPSCLIIRMKKMAYYVKDEHKLHPNAPTSFWVMTYTVNIGYTAEHQIQLRFN